MFPKSCNLNFAISKFGAKNYARFVVPLAADGVNGVNGAKSIARWKLNLLG